MSTADSFKFNLGQYAIGFVGTCASWITMTVSLLHSSTAMDVDGSAFRTSKGLLERSLCTIYLVSWLPLFVVDSKLTHQSRLLIIGALAVPSKNGVGGAKWGQATMVLLWVVSITLSTCGIISLINSSPMTSLSAHLPVSIALCSGHQRPQLMCQTVSWEKSRLPDCGPRRSA